MYSNELMPTFSYRHFGFFGQILCSQDDSEIKVVLQREETIGIRVEEPHPHDLTLPIHGGK